MIASRLHSIRKECRGHLGYELYRCLWDEAARREDSLLRNLQSCLIMTFLGFLSCHQKHSSLPFSDSWNSALSPFSVHFLSVRVDELWIFPLEWEMVVSLLPVIMRAPHCKGGFSGSDQELPA